MEEQSGTAGTSRSNICLESCFAKQLLTERNKQIFQLYLEEKLCSLLERGIEL